MAINHTMTLMAGELKQTREANKILSKRRRVKRSRLQDSGTLSGSQASQLLKDKGLVEQERRDEDAEEGSSKRRRTTARVCGNCHKPGHNIRTCPKAVDISNSSDSE